MKTKSKPTRSKAGRKKSADYKFSWVVWLDRKLARLDFPEMELGKPKLVVTDNGLPGLAQTSKPMSEGAMFARKLAIIRQINPKPLVDAYMSKVEQRLGRAWLKHDDVFLHDFDKASKLKKTTALQRETAGAYRWMRRNVDAVEACTSATQILQIVTEHCPKWQPNESSFFALLREIGLRPCAVKNRQP